MRLINIYNKGRIIYLFTRDLEGRQFIQKVTDFYPYFYESSAEELGKTRSVTGIPVKKMIVSDPKDIRKMRTDKAWDADIFHCQRYMRDKVTTLEKCPIKWAMLDIETLSSEMPDATEAKDPISYITIYNNFSKEYKQYSLKDYDTEYKMMDDFINYIYQSKFDLLTAWNMTEFDMKYLCNRFPDFAERISPIHETRYGGEVAYPAGISIVDYYTWFKSITLNREVSYKLDDIAQKYLGDISKGEFEFGELSGKIKAKNKLDVEQLVRLEEQKQIIPYFDEIRRLSKVEWEDMIWTSRIIDMLILQEAKNRDVVLPMKPSEERGTLAEKEDYLGAYREAIQTGLFKDIGVYDLGCYSEDTEILTEEGWMTYDKLYGNNKLATFNIDKNLIEFQPMLHLNIQTVKDIEMININGQHTNQLLTTTHKVLFKQTTKKYRTHENDPNSWHIQFAKDVPIHHSIFPLSAEIGFKQDYPISDELLKLHAWIITEGTNRKGYSRQKNNKYCIYQSESKHKQYCKEIDDIFNKLQWRVHRYSRLKRTKTEIEWSLSTELSKNIDLEDNYKAIPLWMLKKFSLRQLKMLFLELMKGDGDSKHDCYYAIDKLARERFTYLCCLIGRCGYDNGKKEVYCKSINYTSVQTSKKGKKKINYSGIVWCPSVANGFVVVKRKGKCFISGNSAYPFAIKDFCLDPVNIKLQKEKDCIEINNTYFHQKEDAILPTVVSKLMTLKNDIKKKLSTIQESNPDYKNVEQMYNAIKSIVNSSYGVFGNRYFRMYDNKVASATTFIVRSLLHYVKDKIEELGHEVIYVDTDGVFIKGSIDLTDTMNDLVQQWGKETFGKDKVSIEFEYQGKFKKLLLLTLCRYVGELEKPNGDIKEEMKGIEAKRKDSTVFMKEFQKELIKQIMNEIDKDDTFSWIKNQIEEIKNVPLENISFPVKLARPIESYKNVPIFVRAMNNTENFKKKIGENFYYIYVEPTGYETKKQVIELLDGKKLTPSKLKDDWKLYYGKETLVKHMAQDKKEELINHLEKEGRVTKQIVEVKGKAKDVMAFDPKNKEHIKNVDWKRMIERNILMKLEVIFAAMNWDLGAIL